MVQEITRVSAPSTRFPVLEQTGSLVTRTVSLTQAQYDALPEVHPTILYVIVEAE